MKPEISICVCTYSRPEDLKNCLRGVIKMAKPVPCEIVVVDNDVQQSAKPVVEIFQEIFSDLDILYAN